MGFFIKINVYIMSPLLDTILALERLLDRHVNMDGAMWITCRQIIVGFGIGFSMDIVG